LLLPPPLSGVPEPTKTLLRCTTASATAVTVVR
jgi:hypothetical protein